MINIKKIILVLTFIVFISDYSFSDQFFQYSYAAGDKYRIISEVEEDVFINNTFSHSAVLLNKISVEVLDTKNGSGLLHGMFQTSEKSTGRFRSNILTGSYESEFWRDSRGYYDIDDKYYMPVVRDVPVFPERELAPGDTWSAEGWEVHDFRTSFNYPEPYKFPITVAYQYLGKDETGNYDLISIKYTVFHRQRFPGYTGMYPARVSGASSQVLKWDNHAGMPVSYTEEFNFIFDLSTGDTVEYRGMAKADVIEAQTLDRDKAVRDLREDLDRSGFSDVGVEKVEEGIKLTIENIQFQPDSYRLLDSEIRKLEKISEILKKMPDRDIVITGHTALAGTAEGRKQLSIQRAQVTAEYLLSTGAKNEAEIVVEGMGAEEPVADNRTEAGRSRNRRVEITILEN